MSLVMRKADFCVCENEDADQLGGNREADQRLCFPYIDSTISLLSKSEISSIKPSSVAVQPGLCRTWSETPKTGFLTTRLKCRGRQLILGRLRPSSQLTSTKVLSQFAALTDAPCIPSISSPMDGHQKFGFLSHLLFACAKNTGTF